MHKLTDSISFNGHWLTAGLFYTGVGLILLALTPSQRTLYATDGCGGCPEGQICVQVGENYECECPD